MNFSKIVLNEDLKNQIENVFCSKKIPHALIIEGAGEADRIKLADFLAKSIMCTGEKKPCGQCGQCKKIDDMSHPDYIVFEGKTKSMSVSIDDIRKLRNDAYIVANEGSRKIYLIKNAHKMNEYAQNALLKCLEEPPDNVMIMLECEESAQLLETVRSRCVSFRAGQGVQVEKLSEKDEEASRLGLEIALALVQPSEANLMMLLGKFENDKSLMLLCIEKIICFFSDAVVYLQTGFLRENSSSKKIISLADSIPPERLMNMISALGEISNDVEMNANYSLILSRICYMLRREAGR